MMKLSVFLFSLLICSVSTSGQSQQTADSQEYVLSVFEAHLRAMLDLSSVQGFGTFETIQYGRPTEVDQGVLASRMREYKASFSQGVPSSQGMTDEQAYALALHSFEKPTERIQAPFTLARYHDQFTVTFRNLIVQTSSYGDNGNVTTHAQPKLQAFSSRGDLTVRFSEGWEATRGKNTAEIEETANIPYVMFWGLGSFLDSRFHDINTTGFLIHMSRQNPSIISESQQAIEIRIENPATKVPDIFVFDKNKDFALLERRTYRMGSSGEPYLHSHDVYSEYVSSNGRWWPRLTERIRYRDPQPNTDSEIDRKERIAFDEIAVDGIVEKEKYDFLIPANTHFQAGYGLKNQAILAKLPYLQEFPVHLSSIEESFLDAPVPGVNVHDDFNLSESEAQEDIPSRQQTAISKNLSPPDGESSDVREAEPRANTATGRTSQFPRNLIYFSLALTGILAAVAGLVALTRLIATKR
ncbi:MAG: hypothetical protein RLY93_12570 [Sumerlaeia bacterium]